MKNMTSQIVPAVTAEGLASMELATTYILAKKGYAKAQYEIGKCYFEGKGVKKNEETAVKWYREAAGQGNADAQLELASCYFEGAGVEKDEEEAVKWCRKSARQKNVVAQIFLATCYNTGRGVKQNFEQAEKWFRKASATCRKYHNRHHQDIQE